MLWYLDVLCVGLDSLVCIATSYGMDGLEIEYWWRRDFVHLS